MKKFKLFLLLIITINILLIISPIEKGDSLMVTKEINNLKLNIPYVLNEEISIGEEKKDGHLYTIDNLSDKVITIYGYSHKNNDYPFKALDNYTKNSFFEENSYIYLNNNKYRIFSVFLADDFKPNNNFENLQKKSLFNINYSFNENDKIIILKTNSLEENKDLIICGVLIEENI